MPAACSLGVEAFDAEGVDDDVLRRRGGGDQQRRAEQPRRHGETSDCRARATRSPPSAGVARAPASRAGGRAARQHRHVERVDQRRPQELDACRACRPARTGRWCRDRRRPRASTPAASSRQRQRQAGGEAEEHHDQHARLADRPRSASAKRACAACVCSRCGHCRSVPAGRAALFSAQFAARLKCHSAAPSLARIGAG